MLRGNWWPMLSRADKISLALILITAVVVRIHGLASESFWVDEAASWAFSSMPFSELWGDIHRYEPHPPGYYSLLKLWSAVFGQGESALRGLSVLAGVLTVAMTFIAGRLMFSGSDGTWVGSLAATLVALYPTQIAYSQEARPYALQILGVSMVLLALIWWIKHPQALSRSMRGDVTLEARRNRQAMALFACGLALAIWMHFTAVLLVGSMVGVAFVIIVLQAENRVRVAWKLALLSLLVFVMWLPGFSLAVGALSQHVSQGFWLKPPTVRQVMYGLDFLVGSYGVASRPTTQALAVALGGVIAASGALAMMLRGQGRLALLLCAGIALPIAASVVVSYVVTPIFLPRTLLWVQIAFFLLVGSSVLIFKRWKPRAAVVVLLLSAAFVLKLADTHPKEPWRQIVAMLEKQAGPADLIVAWPNYSQVPMQYYGLAERVSGVRLRTWPRDSLYPTLEECFTGGHMEYTGSQLLSAVRAANESGGAIWLVLRASELNPAVSPTVAFLEVARGKPETVIDFKAGTAGFDPPVKVLRFAPRPR